VCEGGGRSADGLETCLLLFLAREVVATRTGSKGQKPHLRLAVACEGGSSGANEVVAIVCEGDGGAHLHLAKVVAGKRRGNLPVSSLGSLGGSGGVHPIPGLHPSVEGRGTPCDVVVLQRREKMSWDTEFGRTLISNENSNSVSVSLSAHKHEYRAASSSRFNNSEGRCTWPELRNNTSQIFPSGQFEL